MKKSLDLQNDQMPRYQQLTEEVRRQIKSGSLQPGDSLPSISQLRATHGMSKNTIERAHSLLEQEGLVVREHGRGIFVTRPRKRGVLHRTGVIGVYGLLETWASSSNYWTQVLEGIHEELQAHQAHLMLLDPEANGAQDKADGVLINGDYSRPQAKWVRQGWPCVSLFASHPDDEISSIMPEVTAGARRATECLLKLGHERIAYLHNSDEVHGRRLNGYREALRTAGIAQSAEWVHEFHGPIVNFYQPARAAMREWIEDGWRDLGCTALMAHNDDAAAGAIDALSQAGINVPRDVSVVGFDGIDIGEYIRPRLTTVEVPLREIGRLGTRLLLEHIENGTTGIQRIMLPTRLCVRESAALPKARRIYKPSQKKETVK